MLKKKKYNKLFRFKSKPLNSNEGDKVKLDKSKTHSELKLINDEELVFNENNLPTENIGLKFDNMKKINTKEELNVESLKLNNQIIRLNYRAIIRCPTDCMNHINEYHIYGSQH